MSSGSDSPTHLPSSPTQTRPRGKRRRLDPVSSPLRRGLHGKYSDAYRLLFNEQVDHAAARFEINPAWRHNTKQIGASQWSSEEQAVFYAALQRLGRADIPGVAAAIGTKSIPEVQQYLLLLQQAVTQHGTIDIPFRDIPAAVEIGHRCDCELDAAGEALAWYQEMFEARQEQDKFGSLWLITSTIADDIERALADREKSDLTPSDNDQGIQLTDDDKVTRSCTSCKQSQQQCDSKRPCGHCVRQNVPSCHYSDHALGKSSSDMPSSLKDENDAEGSHLLQAIPEASLLQPGMMLVLSKKFFMNRCPTIPSFWPHWSQCTSELAKEPAIYRSAFSDFHNLVISITRRITQTAIVQATSRLRSKGRYTKQNILPVVRRRDVLTAIDVVGMKRNGRERWRGVARRCALRVFEGKQDCAIGKHKRELSWYQVEQLLAVSENPVTPPFSRPESSGDDTGSSQVRVNPKEMPLHMDKLMLADSDSQSEDSDVYSDTESEDQIQPLPVHASPRFRDQSGRYASGLENSVMHHQTLEQFDQQAAQQEEKVLWKALGREPPERKEDAESSSGNESDEQIDEEVAAQTENWREWLEFRPQWETFSTPVPHKLFFTNQKPVENNALAVPEEPLSSSSGDVSAKKTASRLDSRTELRAEGTTSYAILRGRTPASADHDLSTGSSEAGSSEAESNSPT